MRSARILVGDVRRVLPTLPDASVQCCVTSPPYWGLRDYGIPPSVWGGRPDCAHEWGDELKIHKSGPHGDGVMLGGGRAVVEAQAAVKEIRAGAFCSNCGAWRGCLGLEPTFELYVEHMVEVFREVHRVLRPEGTLWLNMGDSYATGTTSERKPTALGKHGYWENPAVNMRIDGRDLGLKPKDLVGIPWRVAFALQADGWWLRSDIIWSKPNPMPESITDRPTKAHEYVFLLAKSERYFYDKDAILEPFADERMGRDGARAPSERDRGGRADGFTKPNGSDPSANGGRNKRSVWLITTQPFPGAHFATMPEDLVDPCVLAGSREGDLVLDPFAGSGTVGVVALRHGREFVGIELNPAYAQLARERIDGDASLFNRTEVVDAG